MKIRLSFFVSFLVCVLALNIHSLHAQGDAPIPIQIGENRPGEFTDPGKSPRYVISVDTPSIVVVQVLALTQFTPTFRVISPFEIELISVTASEGESIAQANVVLPAFGDYIIEVLDAAADNGGTGGGFVISVQGGEVLPPPTPLTLSENIGGEVTESAPAKQYGFNALQDHVLLVTVQSLTPHLDTAPLIALRENSSGAVIALTSAQLIGVTYRIPMGETGYVLDVLQGGSGSTERYVICLETADDAAKCPPFEIPEAPPEITPEPPAESTEAATALPQVVATLPPSPDACLVGSAVGVLINVRGLPALDADIFTQLAADAIAPVIGRSSDNFWWLVEVNGITGWVSSAVTYTTGNCENVQILFSN